MKCPECGMFNACDLEHVSEVYTCSRCKADITAAAMPEPVICKLCGEVCYNPCRRSKVEPAEGVQPCQMRVAQPLLPHVQKIL